MKQQIIAAWDDLELYVNHVKVEATEERTLELNGHKVTLDLSAVHAKTLDEFLAPYLEAGQTVSKPSTNRGRQPGKGSKYYAALRDWADENGREYTKNGKKYNYPPGLVADYDAYLASQGKP